MSGISITRQVHDTLDHTIVRLTSALAAEGFGILTRIDMHTTIKAKIGKDIPPTVILGACNPVMAYEAFSANSNVASLLPCNAVVREVEPSQMAVELTLPSSLLHVLGDDRLTQLAIEADSRLDRALANV